MNLESKIESILFFKGEPVSRKELSKLLDVPRDGLDSAISNLEKEYSDSGVVLVVNGDNISLGTHPDMSPVIESIQKEELSRELSRASLECLTIVLYRGPLPRREIDEIRGVNSSYTLRALLVRGLIEREDSLYRPTTKLLEYLGVKRREELPEFENAFAQLDKFMKEANVGGQ